MHVQFETPEVFCRPKVRPMLVEWLSTGFPEILQNSGCPLFQLKEVFYHYPDDILSSCEGVPEDNRALARFVIAAGHQKVARIRISSEERRTIWTAAHADVYRNWPSDRLWKMARAKLSARRTKEKDRLLVGRRHDIIGPWDLR